MEEKEVAVIRKCFSEYFRKAEISVPQVEQREFGIGGFRKKIESRHMAFASDASLKNYLVQEVPLYISHSMAYYKYPEATPMENKEWMGGDLVFDLDVHGDIFLSEEEIEKVKNDALNLERVLIDDFGVKENEMIRVFSGGRGFHIHVRTPEFRMLGGDERRELTDYVAGIGFRYVDFFDKKEKFGYSGPKGSDWGLRGRFCENVKRIAREEPSRIHRGLKKPEEREKLFNCMEDGNWSKTPIKDVVERVKPAADDMQLKTVEVDTGVTIDTKRLIRVPNTLHGSTGLIAKKLDKIEDFHPYHDALAFGEEPIRIKALQNLEKMEFANRTIERIEKEEEKEVPRSYGIYLLLKGVVKLP